MLDGLLLLVWNTTSPVFWKNQIILPKTIPIDLVRLQNYDTAETLRQIHG